MPLLFCSQDKSHKYLKTQMPKRDLRHVLITDGLKNNRRLSMDMSSGAARLQPLQAF